MAYTVSRMFSAMMDRTAATLAIRHSRLLLVSLIAVMSLTVCSSSWNEITFEYVEEQPPNTKVGNVTAAAGLPAGLTYSLLPLDPDLQGLFVVGHTDGMLRAARRIDRDMLSVCEDQPDCQIIAEIGVRGPAGYAGLVRVTIHILDINDNHPAFPNQNLEIAISETATPGISFVIPTANDPDGGRFAVQSYRFLPNANGATFDVQVTNNSDGTFDLHLLLKERLDREDRHVYRMQVVAKDGGSPPLSGVLNIQVTVLDANDNTPIFLNRSYTVHIQENTRINTTVVNVKAVDQDEGLNGVVVYGFAPETITEYGNVFGINNYTGNIYLREKLNFERDNVYRLVVRAHDRGTDPIYSHAKVFIHIADVNDNQPIIKVNALTNTGDVEIPENADSGTFVAHVAVEDGDSGRFGDISCTLNDNRFDLKRLYETAYRIETVTPFDRERQAHYILRLTCEDHGRPPLSTTKDIHVTILDRNDHSPKFSRPIYTTRIPENNSVPMPVLAVNATDRDVGENGRITYSLDGQGRLLFEINPVTGMITANAVLDYEQMHEVQFYVVAVDNGEPANSATATVILKIIDVNDEIPVFTRQIFHFATFENKPVGTNIGTVTAIDADSSPYNKVRYSLDASRTDVETFEINPNNGSITTKKILDREFTPLHSLVAVASNPDSPAMRSWVNVSIHVADVNDNAPMIIFPNPVNNTAKVPHLAPVGYAFTKIEAVDADFAENRRIQFAFAKGNENGLFDVDPNTGVISTSGLVKDYKNWAFNVIVTVKDHGKPIKTAASEFTIVVEPSIAPIGSSASRASKNNGINLNKHQIILIAMSLTTLFLVSILITAIVLVRRKHLAKDSHKNARSVKFSEILQNARDSDTNMGLKKAARMSAAGSFCEERGPPKEVKFHITNESLDSDDPAPDLCGPATPAAHDTSSLQDSPERKDSLVGSRAASPDPPMYTFHKTSSLPRYRLVENPADITPKPWNLSARELEVHRLLQMSLKEQLQDSDSTSGCSAEVSNTDSGRGPSEDGDNQHRCQDPKQTILNNLAGAADHDHGEHNAGDRPPSYSAIDHLNRSLAQGNNGGMCGQKRKRPGPETTSNLHQNPAQPPYQQQQFPPQSQQQCQFNSHHPNVHHPHQQQAPPPPQQSHPNQTHNYLNIPRAYQPKGYKVVPHSQSLSRGPYRDPRDPRDCGRRSPLNGRSGVDTQRQTQPPGPIAAAHGYAGKHTGSNFSTTFSDRPLTTTFGASRTDSVKTDGGPDMSSRQSSESAPPSGHVANNIAANKRLLLPHVAPGLRDSVV